MTEIFSSSGFKLVSIDGVEKQSPLIDHKKTLTFEKNKVLIYQIDNRPNNHLKLLNEDIAGLVSQVDKDRWFTNVEYLTSLDRMLDEDLIIAGEWLESKFQDLELVTSRVDLHNHRGFNVLGFKEGTSNADEWYVVGAHLDSRNNA